MVELLFVACLQALPADCEEYSLVYPDVSLSACIRRAPPDLAKWNRPHPDRRIARWKCRTVQPYRDT